MTVTRGLSQARARTLLALAATPVAGLREVLQHEAAARRWCGCARASSRAAGSLPHQIVEPTLGAGARCGALSGPSFAEEVARGLPCALTLASRDAGFRARGRGARCTAAGMRVYYSADLVGVEIGGAVKNVMAIAAGISDGLGLGYNARAALITRGLAEIARLGAALGGSPETFMGLAGAGDLILTATGDLSRNRRVGLRARAAAAAAEDPEGPRPRRRRRALGERSGAARRGSMASTCR